MDILIKNGIIVRASETQKGDILIKNGKIEALGDNIEIGNKKIKIIDAEHLLIFPGGIDPHVHLHLPTKAGFSSDDFYSGSKAALYGGTTTIIDFVTPRKGMSLKKALDLRMKEAENSLIDYTFHVSPIEWNDNSEKEIEEIFKLGINSFKIYLAYKDTIGLSYDDAEKVMQVIAKNHGVLAVHCEDDKKIEKHKRKFLKNGDTGVEFHALSRPSKTEYLAVRRIIEVSNRTKCSTYLVHISSKKSLEYIRKAQLKNSKLFAETCPQYLLLDDSLYNGDFEKTSGYVISPPLRKPEDNVKLWNAIADETISTVGTDHCPFTLEQKRKGISDFTKIPNGAGGIEHRLSLLFTYGVLQQRISLNKMVDIFSTAPAKIFGLYPHKGEIAIGSDADLVIWNPYTDNNISVKTHHQNSDINIYDGITAKGNADYVIKNGEIVIEKGELINSEIKGKFLKTR